VLRRNRIALRTRKAGRRWLQTVKAASVSTGGLTSRPEWEQAYQGSFDFSGIDNPAIRKQLERHAAFIVPVFSTRFQRETRLWAPDPQTRVLIMIDSGNVIAGEHRTPICELELELVAGKPKDLLRLACQLAEVLPLLPDDVSKAERGFRLHLGTRAQPTRAEASTIDAGMSPVEAFRTLAFACMRQWQSNAAGAAGHDAPEFIHQLRVSQRRLRSLIGLFEPALPGDFVARWSNALKQNADRFGETRDLDVLADELLTGVRATTAHEEAVLARLHAQVAEQRANARKHTLAALDAAEQGRLLIRLMSDLLDLPTNDLIGSVDLQIFAVLQLERLRKRCNKRLGTASDLLPAHLHALRIAFKQLRYGVEFFAPLLPKKAVTHYLDALTRLQGALGFINDIDVARVRFTAWSATDADLREAAAFVCGWHGPRHARLSRRSVREAATLLKRNRSPWAGLCLPHREETA
jgi:inorganic triphosphatase YgiF